MIQLECDFSQNHHVQLVSPVVHHLAAQAKVEQHISEAFELSDFCHEITQVVAKCLRTLYDFSCVAGKETWKGVKNVLSPEHWQEMASGALQLGVLFLDVVGQEEAGQNTVLVAALSRNYDVIPKLAEEYCLHTEAQKDAINRGAQETYKRIKAMSWQELVENGFELGTTIILDTIALNALSGITKASGRAAIKQISNVMEKGVLFTEQHAVEVAGFGKLLIEEGPEAATRAADIVKNSPELVKAEGSVAKAVRKVVKSNKESKISKNLSISTKHKKRIVEFTDKQLQKKFKHSPDFGVSVPWNKNAALEYKQTLINFIQEEGTEVMSALYRSEPATYYINKKIGLFVVEIGGRYCSGWKLGINQLRNFLNSGNLN